MCSNHPHTRMTRTSNTNLHTPCDAQTRRKNPEPEHPRGTQSHRVHWTTWWLWRGACTRSHPELGRENPQRPWYCGSSRGRVGRRQVFQCTQYNNQNTHAGWSSPVARQAHNLKVTGSNPVPAPNSSRFPAIHSSFRDFSRACVLACANEKIAA